MGSAPESQVSAFSVQSLASWEFAWPAGWREADLNSVGLERHSKDSSFP